ncbi:MAG: GNAT family N-acetyltransferase [Anaerolineae bacterium]
MAVAEQDLGEGLVLRSVRDERDVQAFVALNTAVNGALEGRTCDILLRGHPEAPWSGYQVVEDTASGQIVSSTCLLPWRCSLQGVELRVAMLEMVVTHPDYRRRGLIRAQIERFHQMVREGPYDLCIIQGIPYYYRQFGYAYALDAWNSDSLPAARIPDGPVAYALRPAGVNDAPLLARLYERALAAAGLDIGTLRSEAYWRYLLEWAQWPVRLLQPGSGGEPAGYVVTRPLEGHTGLHVLESGIAGHAEALATLRLLKREASGELRLAWPESGALQRAARALGSSPLPAYQWLVRITDVESCRHKRGPLFARRLAASEAAGMSFDLLINLFRQAYRLRFAGGRLEAVEPAGFVDASMGADGGDLCIPPDAFVRLVLGYRTLDQLRDAWPDIVIRASSRRLLDILFPPLRGWLAVQYHYCGPL